MDAPTFVLASASPRRRRLIGWLGLPVRIAAADTAEDLASALSPADIAVSIAAEKALAVAADRRTETVLAFDTIVVDSGRVLGKPADRDDARRMLASLFGGVHDVVTGVAILPPGAVGPDTFPVTTHVSMRDVSGDAVEAWLAGDDVLGCAGAYNIEHHLASVADDECYQNVAGIPLCHLYRELALGRAGAVPDGLNPPVAACDAALGRTCLLGPQLCATDR
ncbi:MAG: septum formation inhibitor Maf [Actinobacteria bacterium]|nr:septum formation inhibitor Maf [Actinomycetota bacterium]